MLVCLLVLVWLLLSLLLLMIDVFVIVVVVAADFAINFRVLMLKVFQGFANLKFINPVSASASRGILWTRHGTADLTPARK